MDTVFMNSENSKTSGLDRLFLFNLSDKINLKRNDKYVALSNVSMKKYTWKNIKVRQK